MVSYNLSHLIQPDSQEVIGPIQDDEALALFAIIRCMRIRRVLEVGGLGGYSARNFLEAVGPHGTVYTVDVSPVPSLMANHRTILADCRTITGHHLGAEPLDLVFYDCHIYDAQMGMHANLVAAGIITERTVVALHDTNLHPAPIIPWAVKLPEGWMHQDVERRMINAMRNDGYEAFMLHTPLERHDPRLPARHGLTFLTRNRHLAV